MWKRLNYCIFVYLYLGIKDNTVAHSLGKIFNHFINYIILLSFITPNIIL